MRACIMSRSPRGGFASRAHRIGAAMNANLFLNTVLRETFAAMHGIEPDNYDAARYSFDGVDRSCVFDNNRHADYTTPSSLPGCCCATIPRASCSRA